jgi:hypothetical protein
MRISMRIVEMRTVAIMVILVSCGVAQQAPPASGTEAMYQAAARSAQHKFDHIRENAARAHPDTRPTTLTENEIDSWLSSPRAELPQGVKKLQVRGDGGTIHADALVDFDAITAGRRASNPLLSMFRGTHQVQADAHAEGGGGEGRIHIDSVSLDGVEIPHIALEYFVEKYVQPKHPEIGIDTTFRLPARIDAALIGSHQLTLIQR